MCGMLALGALLLGGSALAASKMKAPSLPPSANTPLPDRSSDSVKAAGAAALSKARNRRGQGANIFGFGQTLGGSGFAPQTGSKLLLGS